MGIRTVLDNRACEPDTVIVDKVLSDSYETVRFVASYMDQLKHIAENMAQIYRVHASIAEIDQIHTIIEAIDTISPHTANVSLVATNMTQLLALHAELAKMLELHTELPKLVELHTNLASLLALVFATQAAAEAGTSESGLMNPLRTRQSILANGKDAVFTSSIAGAAATTVDAELDRLGGTLARSLKDVPTLLANTSFEYGPGAQQVASGDIICTREEGFSYEVAASGATDHHLTTAGGVKLYVVVKQTLDPRQFGLACDYDPTGAAENGTDDTVRAQAMLNALTALRVGMVDFGGRYCRITSRLELSGLTGVLFVNGGIHRTTAEGTTGAAIGRILNCKSLSFSLKLSSTYKAFVSGSTGSNALIECSSAAGSLNENISFDYCSFDGGNIAGILVDGRYEPDETKVTNRNIRIQNSSFVNGNASLFVYKGAYGIWFERNTVKDMASLGVAFDTHAADSDLDLDLYKIENVWVVDNNIENVRAFTGFAPRGIVFKGAINHAVVRGNKIKGVSAALNVQTYGILVIRDGVDQPGKDFEISGNIVEECANDTGTGGWSIFVGAGYRNMRQHDNIWRNCQRGCEWDDDTSGYIENDQFINAATGASLGPLRFTRLGTPGAANRKIARGLVFRYGSSGGTTAIVISASVNNLHIGKCEYTGFTAEVSIPSTAVVTGDRYIIARKSLAVNTTLASTTIATLGPVTIAGVATTDLLELHFPTTADDRFVLFKPYRSAADAVSISAVNNSAASRTVTQTLDIIAYRSTIPAY